MKAPDVPTDLIPINPTKEPTTPLLQPEPTTSIPQISLAPAPQPSLKSEAEAPPFPDFSIPVPQPVPASKAEMGSPFIGAGSSLIEG